MLTFQTVPAKDLSFGEDSRSAPSAIPPGYSESLLNVETNSNGWAATRKGYQGYYGWVPLRVNKITHVGTGIQLNFDSSQNIALTTTPNSPLLVYGKLPSGDAPAAGYAGDFGTSNALNYYPSFTLNNKIALTSPSGTEVVSQSDHGIEAYRIWVGLGKVTSTTDASYQSIQPDSIDIDTASYDIDIAYTTPTSESAYIWYLERSAEAGVTYIYTAAAETTVTVPAATHNLDNFGILVRAFDTTVAGTYTNVIPESVTIDTAGEVVVTFTSAFTGEVVLTAADSSNVVTTSAAAGTTTITIPAVTSPWVFMSVYAYNAGTSKFEQVIPDDVSYDGLSGDIDITYTLATGTENVEVYYEYGTSISNSITVQDTGSVSEEYSSLAPQLTVWGISHEGIYTAAATRGGHVTHVDSYTRTGESRAICGLGGNLFAARNRTESGDTYGMPTYYTNLRARVDGDFYLAPLFQETSSTAQRTRGLITDDSIEDNYARVTAVEYVSAGVVDYTLAFTNKTGTLAIGTTLATTDYLTVSGMAWGDYNGTFAVQSVESDSTTAAVIRVTNAAAFAADFDETGADGRAGVFTDSFDVEATPTFVPTDVVKSSAVADSVNLVVSAIDSMTLVVSGVLEQVSFPDGVLIFGTRESRVVPLRTSGLVASVENLVRGDMLEVSDLSRRVRIVSINPNADMNLSSVTGDGTTATATVATAHSLNVGQRIAIAGTGYAGYNGVHVITATPETNKFEFASTETAGSVTGFLVGRTVELDEALEIQDDGSDATEFAVEGRWIPIEAPESQYDLPKTTYIQHLDASAYAEQSKLRSNIIADNMYFTNGNDEVMKFDGDNISRAGLFRWQPQMFVQVDTSTGSITVDTTTVTTSGTGTVSNNRFKIGLGEGQALTVGSRIQDSGDSAIYTIIRIADDGTNDYIYVDRNISDTTASARALSRTTQFRYYFRLNVIDANQNVVASAATGADDYVVELSTAAQIKHRLVGMPALGAYDYDRIELVICRTKGNTQAPFYTARTLTLSFNKLDGYVDFTDGTPDEVLRDFDTVNTALLGAEIGAGWDQPLRAKYVTTAGNRLILSNVKSYPQLDITLRKTGESATLATSDLTGLTWLYRKDSTDTASTTDMLTRAKYEFVGTSGAKTVSSITNTFTFVDADVNTTSNTITKAGHGLVTGDVVVLTSAGTLPVGITSGTAYYVITIDTSTIKLATTLAAAEAGTAVDITSASGGGTHTVTYRSAFIVTLGAGITSLVAGSWVYLYHAAAGTVNSLAFAGWYQVSIANSTSVFTVRHNYDGTLGSGNVDRCVAATAPADVPVLLGTDGNYNWLNANPTTSYEFIAGLRLANAINASMRVCQTADFVPWMIANAGSEYDTGQVIVKQPSVEDTTLEVVLGTISATAPYQVFVNGVLRDSAEQVSAQTLLFPSRTLVSYENYPEIFDSPTASPSESDSVQDINAADGQEIRNAISFFGDASFGSAQTESKIIYLKSLSLYQYDIKTKQYQKIEQPYGGLGAPDSVTQTKDGIIYANDSGILRINKAMAVDRVGEALDRRWKKYVNKDALTEACGHNYTGGNQYKLSVPVGAAQELNNQVYVYDYTKEGKGSEKGAWMRFDNHQATGWTNQGNDSLFGTVTGQVFKIRNANDNTDYRDDDQAISMEIVLRAEDFGVPGINKNGSGVFLEFHNDSGAVAGIEVSAAINLSGTFLDCDAADITDTDQKSTGAWFALPQRKFEKLQVKVACATIDNPVVLAGICFRVAGLEAKGVKEASAL